MNWSPIFITIPSLEFREADKKRKNKKSLPNHPFIANDSKVAVYN